MKLYNIYVVELTDNDYVIQIGLAHVFWDREYDVPEDDVENRITSHLTRVYLLT